MDINNTIYVGVNMGILGCLFLVTVRACLEAEQARREAHDYFVLGEAAHLRAQEAEAALVGATQEIRDLQDRLRVQEVLHAAAEGRAQMYYGWYVEENDARCKLAEQREEICQQLNEVRMHRIELLDERDSLTLALAKAQRACTVLRRKAKKALNW